MRVTKAETEELLSKAFQIRKEVFVVEQQVPAEAEMDQYESMCSHFVVLDEKEDPVGAARWRKTDTGVKLERFAVKKSFRGKGVGSLLLEAVIEDIQFKEGKGIHLYLHAQLLAIPLYEKYDFVQVGDQFEECGIMHYQMIRKS